MMKLMKLVFFLILPLLSACSLCYGIPLPQAYIVSNIPWHQTVITVVNSTPDLVLDVIHDGVLRGENLKSGQYMTIFTRNFSGSPAATTVTVLGKDMENKFVGTANRTFYVTGYSRQSESWSVTISQLQAGTY